MTIEVVHGEKLESIKKMTVEDMQGIRTFVFADYPDRVFLYNADFYHIVELSTGEVWFDDTEDEILWNWTEMAIIPVDVDLKITVRKVGK